MQICTTLYKRHHCRVLKLGQWIVSYSCDGRSYLETVGRLVQVKLYNSRMQSSPFLFFSSSSSSWQTVELIVVGNRGGGRTVDSGTRNRTSDARKPCKLGRLGCLVCNFVIRFFFGGGWFSFGGETQARCFKVSTLP